ncbi:response regulator [Carboxylicivirga mesophila]|uniref:histidine kinase n=1 Tax=Carboxylicivirga mesophila TaxID=1166478 RepID=A0ABS5K807_9BACT|nr:two-component regulator propeller domain-containing protein [Carboxylicivirga mesophila]MBS2211115.1 response regulator [Carboxylicivirga mesophila]
MMQQKVLKTILNIIIVFISLNNTTNSNASELANFIHLTAEVGRKQTIITNVVEDSLGYLWMESKMGILRFDGYDYKHYSNNQIFGFDGYTSSILGITKDSKGQIWFVSKNGKISKLLNSEHFEQRKLGYLHLKDKSELTCMQMTEKRLWVGTNRGAVLGLNLKDSSKITFDILTPNESIISVSKADNNTIWFSTNKGRVFNGNLSTKEFVELKLPRSNQYNNVMLTTDINGNLWIGTELFGLYFYDTKSSTFKQLNNKSNASRFVPSNMIITIFNDRQGIIWAGTDGGGLYRIDPQTHNLKVYNHSKANQFSLQSNTVIGISQSKNDDIWVFTNYGNINILPAESSTIGYHSGSISGSPSRILSVLKTRSNKLWLGTDGEGITIIDENGVPQRQYLAGTKTANGLPGNYIQAMQEDKQGNIWIGTYLNGLAIYDDKTGFFSHVPTSNYTDQPSTDIRSLYIDKQERIWAGSNTGIFIFSKDAKQLAYFPKNKNGLIGDIAEVFMEDENSNIWIGMFGGGIAQFIEAEDLNKSTFINHNISISNTSVENSVYNGVADKLGNLYLINSNSELIKFNIASKKVVLIEGFTNDKLSQVLSITMTDKDNIWTSRTDGIAHIDLANKEYYKYTQKNGTLKGGYLTGSVYNDKNKILYFGGVDGVNFFDPSLMKTQRTKHHLYINHLTIINRDAQQLIPNQLTEGIEHLESITLKPNHNSFTIQFSVIDDYLEPDYYYAYRLKGFDNNWMANDNQRTATYTNIPPGEYTFEVKAGSTRNEWDIAPQSLTIKILTPIGFRWWAITLYIILAVVIGYVIIRYSLLWTRLKRKLMMEEWQNEKNKEVYAMKMNFFAKMSHEIQTPLTLILSPLENMIERAEGNLLLSQRLKIIRNNAKRLSKIAYELATIRNKEVGKLKIKASRNNLAQEIDNIALSFKEQAQYKRINFNTEGVSNQKIWVWYDKDKIEHVVYNLLTNAFKFTQPEGDITLTISEDTSLNAAVITVSDTGIGIPQKDLQKIFDLFYQSPDGERIGGTGIGLALCNELVALHKGEISVRSQVNKGTSVTIYLPLGNQHFSSKEIVPVQVENKNIVQTKIETSDNQRAEQPTNDKNKKNIMLVEDNYEMLMFLEDSFRPDYNVCSVQNGKEAINSIGKFTPDLIISDVMMPLMDGITLCKTLKQEKNTRHIPIILLTTKHAVSSKLEGLKFGAIEYINKPFIVKELLLKVNNILSSQENLIEKYRTDILTNSKEIEVDSPDEVFLESILRELENNFEDPDFRLEELASKLNMSYSNTYRKFQTLTGKTLVDFLRSFRLQKAASLLEKYNFTIAEIAFRVGFNDPKYFSKCFKKEYQKTPREYKTDSKQDN